MSITVNVAGGTACLSTEFGTSPVGATCHLPLNKIVWGDDSVSYKVNETYPLPVQIMEVTGESLVVSGTLGPSGSFPIQNTVNGIPAGIEFIGVAGSTDGTVPVSVTGDISVTNSVTVGNTLAIRNLGHVNDSVTVHGTVGISSGTLNLTPNSDKVAVYGWDGGRYVNATLYGGDGTTIGNSGDALNVKVVNSGVTFSVAVGVTTGVVNGDSGLAVFGVTGGQPIAVKGRNGEAIEVTSTPGTAVAVTGDFFHNGTQSTKVSEIVRPGSIIAGYTLASTNMTQLPSNALKHGITIKAGALNTDFIYVGTSGLSGGITTNGYPLAKGDSVFLQCSNSNLVYVTGTTGDSREVHYIGS